MDKPKRIDREVVTISESLDYMVQAVKGSMSKEDKEKLFRCEDDTQIFQFLWSLPATHDILSFEEEYEAKSEEAAKNQREKGNSYFKQQSYLSASKEYTACICKAPLPSSHLPDGLKRCENPSDQEESTELALAYGNRSAALLQLGKYEDCLKDIERAQGLNYPIHAVHKLLHRQGSCFSKLKQFDDARKSFHLSLEKLDESSCQLDDKMKTSWKKTIGKCLTQMDEELKTHVKETNHSNTGLNQGPLVPQLGSSPNAKIPEASSQLNFKKDSKGQSVVVAKGNIDVGEVLVVEKPYASVLFAGRPQQQRCYHCFSFLPLSPIPCYTCSTVMFCDETCRQESHTKFHQFECKYFALFGDNMCSDVGHLAARLLMTMGPERIIDHMRSTPTDVVSRTKDDRETQIDGDNKSCCDKESSSSSPSSSVSEAIFRLRVGGVRKPSVVNNDEVIPLMELPLFSCFLVKLLHITSYLQMPIPKVEGSNLSCPVDNNKTKNEETEVTNDLDNTQNGLKSHSDFYLLGGFLVRCIRIVRSHAKLIKESKKFRDDNEGLTYTILGIGLYPRAVSRVRHSCDPSCDVVHYNNIAVIRAVKQIGPDEEVSVSFGPLFHETKLEPRRKLLWKAYSFFCNCIACWNKWPVLEEMFEEVPGYRCEECRSVLTASDKVESKFLLCPICKHKQNLEEIVDKLRTSFDNYAGAMNDAMSGDHEGALPRLRDHLKLIQKHIRQPWPDLVASQTAVKLCYRLTANKSL